VSEETTTAALSDEEIEERAQALIADLRQQVTSATATRDAATVSLSQLDEEIARIQREKAECDTQVGTATARRDRARAEAQVAAGTIGADADVIKRGQLVAAADQLVARQTDLAATLELLTQERPGRALLLSSREQELEMTQTEMATQVAALEALRQEAHRRRGEAELAAVRADLDALTDVLLAAEQQLLAARQTLRTAQATVRSRLSPWPELDQQREALIPEPTNLMIEGIDLVLATYAWLAKNAGKLATTNIWVPGEAGRWNLGTLMALPNNVSLILERGEPDDRDVLHRLRYNAMEARKAVVALARRTAAD
jgi:chromosome segregation ATPase